MLIGRACLQTSMLASFLALGLRASPSTLARELWLAENQQLSSIQSRIKD